MRLAALVPTRNRPEFAVRAVESFLEALSGIGLADHSSIVVADDSDNPSFAIALDEMLGGTRESHCSVSVQVRPLEPHEYRVSGRGPGAVRNRALRILRDQSEVADVTIMFDDDVVFRDVSYLDQVFSCDGSRLLRSAIEECSQLRTVTGCAYSGRQDLSILEHLRLDPRVNSAGIVPAVDRGSTDNVAPGGISTAFLAIAGHASTLPNFPEHYNEDYVWLHCLSRMGWRLVKLDETLVHAPPGQVEFTAEGLDFQIFGEIVWLAVLEHDRYPLEQPTAIAAAVEEIVGDLRDAARTQIASGCHLTTQITESIRRFEEAGRRIALGRPCATGVALIAAIRAALRVGDRVDKGVEIDVQKSMSKKRISGPYP